MLVNKRLDSWVSEDCLEVDKMQLPKKEENRAKSKISKGSAESKPSSPDREHGGTKKSLVNRKRKAAAISKGSEEVQILFLINI